MFEFKRKSLAITLALVGFIALVLLGYLLVCSKAERESENNYPAAVMNGKEFEWPEGKKAAISLSFDDGRLSQIQRGLPILDKHGVKATFYVLPQISVLQAVEWKKAIKNGHEIGSHSLNHPCSVNYSSYWGAGKIGLEDYSHEMMKAEIFDSNQEIGLLLGVRPRTFAYPCGQKFIGRGGSVDSYVPLIAEQFIVGRGWLDEEPNNPSYCDLAQVMGMSMDNRDFSDLKELLDSAVKNGQWLVLVGHEVGRAGELSTGASTLEAICKYAGNPANGVWIDTVNAVGSYVLREQLKIEEIKQRNEQVDPASG